MPRLAPRDNHDKFSRYRASKRQQGMKLVRLWVPDPTFPGFAEEAQRQAMVLQGAAEEQEALDFIESAISELALDPYEWSPDAPLVGTPTPQPVSEQ